ncbi:hypothetical protein WICMUC_000893 [Wickerhamomyces mucosus]|uniref:Pre-mRNA-splicing factor n=1 Tax=Wickerhamomyces mucosus TaxID=1378264 RepID=A0A9P8PXW3_9ASCO|nr:hypothetical protein WICMUC_000893 [Wickerhamomyces mucosus]
MVSFSLKSQDRKRNEGLSKFSLKKSNNAIKVETTKINKAFGETHDDDENKEIKIDTFNQNEGGAFDNENRLLVKKELLVIPNKGNLWKEKLIEKHSRPVVVSDDAKLKYGMNFSVTSKDKISSEGGQNPVPLKQSSVQNDKDNDNDDMPTSEDYQRVPVEEFGVAMLRGMGWTGDSETKETNIAKSKKRSQYLGLGAKDIYDADTQLNKEYVPVKKLDRRSGKRVDERDRSPNRNSSNTYKSRS